MGFGKYLPRARFFEIESKIRFGPPEDPDLDAEDRDPFYPVRRLIERFNDHRKALITAGAYITLDEMMSAWKGAEDKYTAEGCQGLTYIARKPEP